MSVDEQRSADVESFEGAECVAVGDAYGSFPVVVAEQADLDEAMGGSDFHELGTLLTCGRNNAVGAEIALVRAGVVIAGMQPVDALFDLLWIVDGLVDPVPDAASDCGVGVFHDFPVFRKVADGISHRMGVFAEYHGLVKSARVFVHPFHAGIHFRVEVGEAASAIWFVGTGAFIVDGSGGVERRGGVIAPLEVLAVAGLVAEAPHYYRGVVAISKHHAVDAVDKRRNP